MTTNPNQSSLGKRYLFKLISNAATLPLFIVLEAVLPRALGPENYGNYSFATLLFYQFITFLDMGSSTCFSTLLAKRPQEFGLVAFYSRIAVGVFLLCGITALSMVLPQVGDVFMPGVPLWLALPAALWGYLTWLGRVTRSVNDALGITTSSEIVRMVVNMGSAILLLGLFFSGWLSMPVIFAHQYITLACLSVGFCFTLRHQWPEKVWQLSKKTYKKYTKEFWRFSGPLFVLTLSSSLALSGERWFLQFFSGSAEQGYFSLAQKVSMGCFLFVTAMTPLLMRELAVAHGKNDPQSMARLLDRYAPMLYAIAAWFACFSSIEGAAVVKLFGGSKFSGALLPVQIMTLYAVHQGYGQIASAVFYATGDTRALRNLTIGCLLLGIGCVYLFLAPHAWGGLELGAMGLALKMVIMQVLTINILLIACRRIVPFNLPRNILHQIVCPFVFIVAALCTKHATQLAGIGGEDDFIRFFLSGFCYTLLCSLLVYIMPFTAGLDKQDIPRIAQGLTTFWHKVSSSRR